MTEHKSKEIQISLAIADHDLNTKIKKTQKLLDKGFRIKVSMKFSGREISKSDFGKIKFNKMINAVDGKVMVTPILKGNIMFMWFSPNSK